MVMCRLLNRQRLTMAWTSFQGTFIRPPKQTAALYKEYQKETNILVYTPQPYLCSIEI